MEYKLLNKYTLLNFFNYSSPLKPNSVCMDITQKCNLKCPFCEIGVGIKNDFSKELTKKELFGIIDQLSRWKIKCINVISGGEPFIRKDIWEFLEYCILKDIHIDTICTNGTLLSDINTGQFKILSKSTTRLSVSLDSADVKKHDSFRGIQGTYDKLINGIRNIISLKQTNKSKIFISTATVINRDNHNEIQDIILLDKRLSIESAVFQPVNCMPNFYGCPPAPEKSRFLFKNSDELRELEENIHKGIKAGYATGIKNNLSELSKWIMPYFEYTIKPDTDKDYFFKKINKNFKCFVPFSHLKINSEGYILPCYLLPPVNNIRNTDIKDSWLKDINPVRNHLRSGKFFEQCKTCYCDFPYSLKYNLPFYPFKGRLFFLNIVIYYVKRVIAIFKP